ncbi:lysozyme B [Drosophila grimshawi]|nr:lysozyme B [Drosophila grimshawi]
MDRCSLALEMANLGVPLDQLARWTCLAKHESAYRTEVLGSNNYGIFQIGNHWCKPSNNRYSQNACSLSCSDLLTDDITSSVQCAQKILGTRGWSAWATLPLCSAELPPIDDCF